jgi:predicted lipid-binding transport protein (Tim44 family)
MNYSFEYIDIILLAMIAGFIFLRLRGILGKKTGHEENLDSSFSHDLPTKEILKNKLNLSNFDQEAKENFLKGAKIAYETIIIAFASGNLKNIRSLLGKNVFDQFSEAVKVRENEGHISETTFIGVNSASIKEHKKINNILEVTVDFVSEIISCVKDKNNKILSGDTDKVKKVFDTWIFSKDSRSSNPNWLLIDTQI